MDTKLTNKVYAAVIADLKAEQAIIPRIPSHVTMIDRCVRDENKSTKDLARLIEAEPSLAVRVMQVANSPFYGSINKVSSLQLAISRLGMRMTRNIVIALAVRDVFRSTDTYINSKLNQLWNESVDVAAIAAVLARVNRKDVDNTLLGGMIHDVGYLAVVGYWFKYGQRAGEDKKQLLENVAPLLSCSLGGTILTEWKFPSDLIDIVQKHCDPESVDDTVQLVDFIVTAKEYKRVQRNEITEDDFNNTKSVVKTNLNYSKVCELIDEFNEMCEDIKLPFK